MEVRPIMDRIPLADSPAAVAAGAAGRAPQRRAETDGSSQDGRPNGGRAGERTKCGCSTLWWTCGGGPHLTGLCGIWRTRCSGCSGSSRWSLGGRKWLGGGSGCRGKRCRCGRLRSCCPRVCRRQASRKRGPWGNGAPCWMRTGLGEQVPLSP